jgi:hypothetical protein
MRSPTDDDLTIGGRAKWAYRGSIDELRVYNRALTGQEIRDIIGGPPDRRSPAE